MLRAGTIKLLFLWRMEEAYCRQILQNTLDWLRNFVFSMRMTCQMVICYFIEISYYD